LLWIDTHILAVSFGIAAIIVRRVKKSVVMQFMNEWK
jgi:hypothetical protein